MTSTIYAVYGASGYGREVMPLARAHLQGAGTSEAELYFVDDGSPGRTVNGHHVVSYDDFLRIPAEVRFVAIAIADGKVRESLSEKCRRDGVRPWDVKADNVVIMDNVVVGDGCLLSPFVTITSNARIGRYFHANIYSYVAHDCRVGDFVTFAPGVKCNGNIVIEDYVYVGTGAIIRQGHPDKPLTIGRGSIVGMGAVVTKDVPPGVTVVGNPAKPMNRE